MMNTLVKKEVTGVVLAGGKSSRFGSNKALCRLGNERFLEKAIHLLQPLCAEVFISGHPKEYREQNECSILKDVYEGCGPLGGIHAALQTADTPYVLFLTCDMPFMRSEPLQHMMTEATGADVVGWKENLSNLLTENAPHPTNESTKIKVGGLFPLLVSTALLPEIECALKRGDYKIRRVLCEREKIRMLEIPDGWTDLFTNINKREDLERMIEREL